MKASLAPVVCAASAIEEPEAKRRFSAGQAKRQGLHRDRARLQQSHAAIHYREGVPLPIMAIHCDGWRGYDGLMDVGYAKHF